jgi:hypothetical protein
MHDKIKYSTCHVTPGRPAALRPPRVELHALVRDSCVGERSEKVVLKDQVSTPKPPHKYLGNYKINFTF